MIFSRYIKKLVKNLKCTFFCQLCVCLNEMAKFILLYLWPLVGKLKVKYNFSSHIYCVPSLKGAGRHIVCGVDPVCVGVAQSYVEGISGTSR